ncbi:hypothetical protein JM16_006636 [Phytophthora kernoviae]|uniref:Uncharacterized protein n=1 Tax=Phytophthora kernoviae TaxID=325452 RepID=A0A8T0LN84_9STRA|nr:hypothetical protein JM16_006636 [Phytophthora kernoviae]
MKRSVLKDVNFVFEKKPTFQDPLAIVDNSDVIMAQLEKKVSEMYLGTNTLFALELGAPSISCQMKQRFDRYLGKTIEISTCAPLECSMETASDALWKELTTIRTYPDKSYRYMQTSKPNSMEKKFDQILRGNGGATPVNGLQYMRKFEEANRIVLTRASTMLLPTEGMHMGYDQGHFKEVNVLNGCWGVDSIKAKWLKLITVSKTAMSRQVRVEQSGVLHNKRV